MAYTFDSIFAVDPNNPNNAAKNAAITIFDPADPAQSPIVITDPTGSPLPNPVTVDAAGMGPAFQHPTLARVGWKGAGFTNYFTSYEGMFNETVAAKDAALVAAANAAEAAQADIEARITSGELKGEKGADGSNVLPTDTAIKEAIENASSETRAALEVATASKLDRMQVTSHNPGKPSPVALGSMQIKGYDPVDNFSFWTDTSFIYRSVDGGVTRGAGKVAPTGVVTTNISKFVRFKGNIYLFAPTTAGAQVFRAAPVNITMSYTWSEPLVTLTTGSATLGTAMNADDQYLYVGEYGEPTGGPSIWRSPDGTTWEKVVGPFTTRHIHAVTPDPYRPGHVYATIGDTNIQPIIWRSTNYGAPGSWTQVTNLAAYLAVQISFSEDYVWFAGDGGAFTVAVMDRDELVPRVATPSVHMEFAVPGGAGRRVVTDGTCANGSTTFTSATANFTADDRGKRIYFPLVLPNTWITAVNSATSVTLSNAAFGASTTQRTFIDGDRFMDGIFYGTVDPATGVYYCIANDVSGKGNRSGLFMLPAVGAELVLLETYDSNLSGEMFAVQGKILAHSRARTPMVLAS